MTMIVYSPDIINSYIRFVYTTREEFDNDNEVSILKYVPFYLNDNMHPTGRCKDEIQILPDITADNICVIKFDKNKSIWNIFHKMDKIKCDTMNFNFSNLHPGQTYLGIVTETGFHIIQSIDNNGNAHNFCSDEIYFYHIKNNITYQKSYLSDHSDRYFALKQKPFARFNDIIVICKEKGVICLNPGSCIDLIFCFMVAPTNEKIKEISEILASASYHEASYPAFRNFIDKFLNIQNKNPLPGYGIIYKYFKSNDQKYFDSKIKIFQENVLDILGKVRTISHSDLGLFISDFVINFRNDICIELGTLYHRFRHFPKEKDIIYKKYRNHPYIKILKMVHRKYLEMRKNTPNMGRITPDIIFDILFGYRENVSNEKYSPYFIYNENINLLMTAIRERSKLFGPTYDIYLETINKGIKPKYRTRYNYFPFKIFSPYIFIMEHILTTP